MLCCSCRPLLASNGRYRITLEVNDFYIAQVYAWRLEFPTLVRPVAVVIVRTNLFSPLGIVPHDFRYTTPDLRLVTKLKRLL